MGEIWQQREIMQRELLDFCGFWSIKMLEGICILLTENVRSLLRDHLHTHVVLQNWECACMQSHTHVTSSSLIWSLSPTVTLLITSQVSLDPSQPLLWRRMIPERLQNSTTLVNLGICPIRTPTWREFRNPSKSSGIQATHIKGRHSEGDFKFLKAHATLTQSPQVSPGYTDFTKI